MNYDMLMLHKISIRLYNVLEEVGATQAMVKYRRQTFLSKEAVMTIASNNVSVQGDRFFHFGSQTEGTTTADMGSDTDGLLHFSFINVFSDVSKTVPEKLNLRLLKDENSAPRHCFLQQYNMCDITSPEDSDRCVTTVIDLEGRVLLQNKFAIGTMETLILTNGLRVCKHGPSVSHDDDMDLIYGFSCKQLPQEYQAWLFRPRPSLWPTSELLTKASNCESFLLPVGHPESETGMEEWRFSTSHIERMLMFDLNIVQLQVYILLKLVKKSFFKPFIGDHVTSFHCKTVLLFTAEYIPRPLWKVENLLFCLLLCLNTLRRFLVNAYCPHYVLQTNLLIGKLPYQEITKVIKILTDIIQDPVRHLCSIHSDGIGNRMLGLTTVGCYRFQMFSSQDQTQTKLVKTLLVTLVERIERKFFDFLRMVQNMSALDSVRAIDKRLKLYIEFITKGSPYEQFIAKILFPKCCSMSASIQASESFASSSKKTLALKTLKMLHFCRKGDIASKLKFASVYYCKCDYVFLERVLYDIENGYEKETIAFCECKPFLFYQLKQLPASVLKLDIVESTNKYIAPCFKFTELEVNCVPSHLADWLSPFDKEEACESAGWNMIRVDCLPFLYYLQYLTYRELKKESEKNAAFTKLKQYSWSVDKGHGHFETTLNMLGHCCELEGETSVANLLYNISKSGAKVCDIVFNTLDRTTLNRAANAMLVDKRSSAIDSQMQNYQENVKAFEEQLLEKDEQQQKHNMLIQIVKDYIERMNTSVMIWNLFKDKKAFNDCINDVKNTK